MIILVLLCKLFFTITVTIKWSLNLALTICISVKCLVTFHVNSDITVIFAVIFDGSVEVL